MLLASLVTSERSVCGFCDVDMAGVGALAEHDVPDSMIGRFIDRLDHIQFRIANPLSESVASFQRQGDTHSSTISSLQTIVREHAAMMVDHESRLAQLQSSFGAITARPPSVASHRGAGTTLPAPQPMVQGSDIHAGLGEAETKRPALLLSGRLCMRNLTYQHQ